MLLKFNWSYTDWNLFFTYLKKIYFVLASYPVGTLKELALSDLEKEKRFFFSFPSCICEESKKIYTEFRVCIQTHDATVKLFTPNQIFSFCHTIVSPIPRN